MASTEPDQDVTPALGAALAEPGVRRYRRKPSEVDAIQWTGGNLPSAPPEPQRRRDGLQRRRDDFGDRA